jgi:hypothetical protein
MLIIFVPKRTSQRDGLEGSGISSDRAELSSKAETLAAIRGNA